MNTITRFLAPLIALLFVGFSEAREITLINKTDRPLGVTTVNFPFNRSNIDDVILRWLDPDEEITLNTLSRRLIGWYQPGLPVNYTVLQRRDTVIAFVTHGGEIKSLHGRPIRERITNDSYDPIFVTTKNDNEGNIDCQDCVEECYSDENTLVDCDCINWCWDHTQDMEWYLSPGRSIKVLLAKGTRYGLSEAEIVYDTFYDDVYVY